MTAANSASSRRKVSNARSSGARRRHVWLSRVGLTLITVAATVMALVAPAAAYWSGQGSGTGQARTNTLAAPTNVKATTPDGSSVTVTWTESTGLPPTGYYVTSNKGGVIAPACGTSPRTLITTATCTDTGLPPGTYTYTVVAVLQSWTAVSAASASVVTGNRLGVTQQPPATVQSAAKFGPVVIQLQSSTGSPLAKSGVSIKLKINSSTATLSGPLTATTNTSGVASFNNLSVNLAGTYTLTASATGYVAATTTSFSVTAGAPASIVAVSGSGQSAKSGSTFAQPFVVRVTDAAGNQVTGVTVNFTIQPSGSASGTIVGNASPQTGSDGTASVTVRATGASAGSPTLTATVANGGTPNLTVKFNMTNTIAAAAKVAPAPALPNEPTTAPQSAPTSPPAEPSTSPSSTPTSPEPSSEPSATSAPATSAPATSAPATSAPATSAPASPAPSGTPVPSGSASPPSG